MIAGHTVSCGTGELPEDFQHRLEDALLDLCATPLATVSELSRFIREPVSSVRDRLARLRPARAGRLAPAQPRRTRRAIAAALVPERGGDRRGRGSRPAAATNCCARLPLAPVVPPAGRAVRCGRVARPRLGGRGGTRRRAAHDRPRLDALRDLRPRQGGRPPARLHGRARLSPAARGGGRLRRGADGAAARGPRQTADGRVLKLLNIVDEHTREALAIVAARSITADATASTLDRIVAVRGTAPAYIRCDNGPELTANALRDWCRFSGTGSSYIEPGAPWENPYVESFNGRLRDEFLAVEQFDSLLEAQVLIEDWRIEYNTKRPHSSLGWLAPAAYAERCEAQQHAGLS